eukprot:scaffold448689_cov52-Prasinocladus_malaysianus.AAC.1
MERSITTALRHTTQAQYYKHHFILTGTSRWQNRPSIHYSRNSIGVMEMQTSDLSYKVARELNTSRIIRIQAFVASSFINT